MEKYSLYKYEVLKECDAHWDYKIYDEGEVIRQGDEYYESEKKARIAAKAHIDRLEEGEG